MINGNKTVEVVPAVLPKSFSELEEGLERLRGVSKVVQVDVTVDFFGNAEAMPFWEEFDFEFDLFIEPAPFIERAVGLGASRVIVHERFKTAREALEMLQGKRTGDFAIAVGLGLQATDSTKIIAAYEGLYDFVQVMGILQEGGQGHPPAPEAPALVAALRAAYPDIYIQVDGAVAPREEEFVRAGADKLVVGKAIVKADDPMATYKELYNVANGAQ